MQQQWYQVRGTAVYTVHTYGTIAAADVLFCCEKCVCCHPFRSTVCCIPGQTAPFGRFVYDMGACISRGTCCRCHVLRWLADLSIYYPCRTDREHLTSLTCLGKEKSKHRKTWKILTLTFTAGKSTTDGCIQIIQFALDRRRRHRHRCFC